MHQLQARNVEAAEYFFASASSSV